MQSLATSRAVTLVTLGFDDGLTQVKLRGMLVDPVRGFLPATFYINSDRIGWTGWLNDEQLAVLAADGHEIAGHDLGHTRLAGLGYDESRRLICDDKAALEARGFEISSFAWPFGAEDADSIRAAISCGMESARDVGGVGTHEACTTCADTLPPSNLYSVRSPPSFNCQSAAVMMSILDRAIANGGEWVNFIFHEIIEDNVACRPYATKRSDLTTFLDYVAQKQREGAILVRRHKDVVGIRNSSFERVSATDPTVSECWERVVYKQTTGSFGRAAFGRSGSAAEQIDITSVVDGNRKLLFDRNRAECMPAGRPGHVYRMSAWYQLLRHDPAVPNRVRFILYYKSYETGQWITFADSPSFASSTTWKRMVWDTPPLPADATALRGGVYVNAPGLLTIDDVLFTDLGPSQ